MLGELIFILYFCGYTEGSALMGTSVDAFEFLLSRTSYKVLFEVLPCIVSLVEGVQQNHVCCFHPGSCGTRD